MLAETGKELQCQERGRLLQCLKEQASSCVARKGGLAAMLAKAGRQLQRLRNIVCHTAGISMLTAGSSILTAAHAVSCTNA